VTVGIKDDGRPDRRHVMSKNRQRFIRKVRDLEKLRDAARAPKPGQCWTVATWLTHWIGNIAVPLHVSENTHAGYRVDIEKHLIPASAYTVSRDCIPSMRKSSTRRCSAMA
jgi:integrase